LIGPAVYRGRGFWEIALTPAEKAKGWEVRVKDGVQKIYVKVDGGYKEITKR